MTQLLMPGLVVLADQVQCPPKSLLTELMLKREMQNSMKSVDRLGLRRLVNSGKSQVLL